MILSGLGAKLVSVKTTIIIRGYSQHLITQITFALHIFTVLNVTAFSSRLFHLENYAFIRDIIESNILPNDYKMATAPLPIRTTLHE